MEYVAASIVEWTQQEEAKYQAVLLAAEVEKLQQEENEAASPVPGDKQNGKKGDRAKSPPKKGGRLVQNHVLKSCLVFDTLRRVILNKKRRFRFFRIMCCDVFIWFKRENTFQMVVVQRTLLVKIDV